jgi:hypothetical protein
LSSRKLELYADKSGNDRKKIEIAPFVYDQDDVIFYALSVGAGVAEIDFIYEKNLKYY